MVSYENIEPEGVNSLLLENIVTGYCRNWGRPLKPGFKPAIPLNRSGIIRYVLNYMRFREKADITFMNRSFFEEHPELPLTTALTKADIYTIMPYASRPAEIQLTGADLARLKNT